MNKELLKMTVVLFIISLVASFLLSGSYDITKEPIEEQKRQELLISLKAVLPEYDNDPVADGMEVASGKDKAGNDVKTTVYVAKKGGSVAGMAFRTSSREGYSGTIEIMVGVDTAGTVLGVEILSHTETPGLGEKISKDKKWKDSFKGRNLENTNWMVKKDGGDIDQFAGATISPRAVANAVKAGLEFYKAKLVQKG